MKKYKALKNITFASYPNDIPVKKGEAVELEGYITGNPVIRLNPTIHRPDYDHLKNVCVIFDVESRGEFETHFTGVL